MKREWRPPKQRQTEKPVVIRPPGQRRQTALSLVEWENPQLLPPDVRRARIRDTFRPRWDYEHMREGSGVEVVSNANSRS